MFKNFLRHLWFQNIFYFFCMSKSLGAILFLTSSVGLKFIPNWCTMRIYSSTYVYRLNVFFFGYCEQTRHRTTKFDHSLESLGCKLSIVRWIIVLAFVSVDIFWINVDTRGNWHLPKNGKKTKVSFYWLKISNGFINNESIENLPRKHL